MKPNLPPSAQHQTKETLDRTINELELEPAASIDIMPARQALKTHAIGLSTWCNKKDISKAQHIFTLLDGIP
jgi:hypothetical protein